MRRPRIPVPTLALLAVTALLAATALLGACGSGDVALPEKASGKRPASTTSTTEDSGSSGSSSGSSAGIASGILSNSDSSQIDGSAVGTDEESCLGQFVIDAVGEDEATAMSDAPLSSYTAQQLDVLRNGFNKCVSGASIAEALVKSFYQGAGAKTPPDPSVTACMGTALDGHTGDVVVESAQLDTSTALPQVTLKALDGCVPAADVGALLQDAFAQTGMTSTQATCMATALAGKISVSQLAALGSASTIPPEIQSLINEAAAGCPK
jgi:hypothetical protein